MKKKIPLIIFLCSSFLLIHNIDDDVDDIDDDGYEGWRVSEWEDDEKVDYDKQKACDVHT